MSNSAEPAAVGQPSFEQALAALEQIVRDLEDGQLGLTESLGRYEEGVRLLKQCHGLLERAERKIELLSGIDAAGNPIAEPFDDAGVAPLAEKAEARSRRRSKSGAKPPPASTPAEEPAEERGGTLFP